MRLMTSLAAIALAASPAFADEFTPALQSYLNDEVSRWAQSPEIVAAIKAQNEAHAGLTQSQIDEMDQAWRANVGDPSSDIIAPVLNNVVSDNLRDRVDASDGSITEVFVMDQHGLNVAASDVTSDMWQGDEAKFQKTYGMGPDGKHVSEVELDESTQRYQGQVSLTIIDPDTGAPIGAITVGVDAESLL